MPTGLSASTDQLTGLLTRKAFHDALDDLLLKARGAETPISLGLIDIDRFLEINDQFGHAAGDDALKAIAGLVEAVAGSQGICVRYGGDEFAILLPDVEREQAFLTLEKLRGDAVQAAFRVGKNQDLIQGISLCAGISCYPMDGRLKSELLRKADQALYRAKTSGRGKIRLAYDERMVPKTSHYTQTQLERLTKLALERQVGEAELLREALDDLLAKFGVNEIDWRA